jgi:hypothetical protein
MKLNEHKQRNQENAKDKSIEVPKVITDPTGTSSAQMKLRTDLNQKPGLSDLFSPF